VVSVSFPLRQWFWKRMESLTPPEDYAIDYMIAPWLGRVEDIRNL